MTLIDHIVRSFRQPHLSMLAIVLSLTAFVGCNPPGKPDPKNQFVAPNQIVDFEELFSQNCSGCHGANGTLGPAPPLRDAIFAALISREELEQIVRAGRRGTPMPAFSIQSGGTLTEEQISILANGIKNHSHPNDSIPSNLPPYQVTAGTSDTPAGHPQRGAELFAKACINCHGPDGQGIDDAGQLKNTIHQSAFLALISDQALRRVIITGRPDLGMPNFSDDTGRGKDFHPLTSAEIDDLLALLARWRQSDDPLSQSGH